VTDKTIDTLVSDIYAIFSHEEPFEPALFREFGDNLHDLMETRFHGKRDQTPRLRMSNIGRPDRQLWYDIRSADNTKDPFTPPTYVKFAYGDMIEQMMLLYAKMAGHTVTNEQQEVEIDAVKGHIDAIIDGVLVDVKSASSFSFAKFETRSLFEKGNDPFGYVAQLCAYMEATGCERGGFLAVDKTLGKICFCEIPEEIVAQYRVRERIAHIKQVVSSDALPDRCYADVPDGKSGNMKLAAGCSYCPHKFTCWGNLEVYYYSTGPRYFTRVLREPKVDGGPMTAGSPER
jgi:hypothetical protein